MNRHSAVMQKFLVSYLFACLLLFVSQWTCEFFSSIGDTPLLSLFYLDSSFVPDCQFLEPLLNFVAQKMFQKLLSLLNLLHPCKQPFIGGALVTFTTEWCLETKTQVLAMLIAMGDPLLPSCVIRIRNLKNLHTYTHTYLYLFL